MRILAHTTQRLVIEHRPRLAYFIMGGLGLAAVAGSLHALLVARAPVDAGTIIGLVMGLVCLLGPVLLYRETTTTLDRASGRVTWHQRGLTSVKSDAARIEQIRDVVTARHQGGGASRVCLVLQDRTLPLMFGFHGMGGNQRIEAAIRTFISAA